VVAAESESLAEALLSSKFKLRLAVGSAASGATRGVFGTDTLVSTLAGSCSGVFVDAPVTGFRGVVGADLLPALISTTKLSSTSPFSKSSVELESCCCFAAAIRCLAAFLAAASLDFASRFTFSWSTVAGDLVVADPGPFRVVRGEDDDLEALVPFMWPGSACSGVFSFWELSV